MNICSCSYKSILLLKLQLVFLQIPLKMLSAWLNVFLGILLLQVIETSSLNSKVEMIRVNITRFSKQAVACILGTAGPRDSHSLPYPSSIYRSLVLTPAPDWPHALTTSLCLHVVRLQALWPLWGHSHTALSSKEDSFSRINIRGGYFESCPPLWLSIEWETGIV